MTYTPIALIRFGPNGNTVTIKVFLSEAWPPKNFFEVTFIQTYKS